MPFALVEGMAALDRLPLFDTRGNPRVVVEVPGGSTAKFKFDPKLEAFLFQRRLELGLAYPHAWGFFPSTLADDGDPLDAMVWQDNALPQGCVIAVSPVALARVTQVQKGQSGETRNDRVIAVPAESEKSFTFAAAMREQLAQFFVRAAAGSGHDAQVERWDGASEARAAINQAAHRFDAARRR